MPLIRLISSVLLAFIAFTAMPLAHAEETLALNTSQIESLAPDSLSSARNIKLELIPDIDQPMNIALPMSDDQSMNDLWERIRVGFAMRDLNSPLIAKHEQWYANRPDYVTRMTERARRYLYYITCEVERRGMPTEIALLPMIESAFNPGAYSTSRASGIWQFIPSTGKNFGMQQNWWYDGRRDVISATNGALDYLQKLHNMFGDWELALAAYNWGEGAVQRAQERNRKRGLPVNYSSLKMPNETRSYVPKLLAVRNIVANPANFDLVLQDIPNEPYFAAVSTTKHIDVKLAAQLADIPMEEFMALNPGHNRPVILQGSNDLILLPINKMENFRANLEGYDKPLVNWQSYQPKKGDRLDKLAPRFGLSIEKLRLVNSLGRGSVSTGQTLLVPINIEDSVPDGEFEVFNMHLAPTSDGVTRTIKHTVRQGETLASVAKRYHVSVASLQNSNTTLKQLKPGQTITIVQVTSRKHTNRLAKSDRRSRKLAQTGTTRKPVLNKIQKRVHVAYNSTASSAI